MSDKTLEELLAQVQAKQAAPVPCNFCGTEFRPKREWQKFCSTRCRISNHEEKERQIRAQEKLEEAKQKERFVLEFQSLRGDLAEMRLANAELREELARMQVRLQASSGMMHSGDVGQSDRSNAQ